MQREVDVDLPRGIIRACLLLVVFVALGVLILGWGVGFPSVRAVVLGWPEMVPLTALCFLISAVAIGLFSHAQSGEGPMRRSYRLALLALSGGLIALSGYDLVDHFLGWGGDLDWLGLDPLSIVGQSHFDNAMAPTAAVGFFATGLTLLISVRQGPRLVINGGNLMVMLIGSFAMCGYLFGGSPLLPSSPMGVHTALCFVFIATALSGVQSNSWLTRLLETSDASGMVIQRMTLLAVAGPILTGAILVSGRLMGWYGAETAMGLFCILLLIIGCSLVAITERQLRLIRAKLSEQQFLAEETERIGKIGGWENYEVKRGGAWTPEVAKIHGLSPETPWNPDIFEKGIHSEDRSRVSEAYLQTCEKRQPYDIQYRLVMPTGELKWVRAQGYPIITHGRVTKVRGTLQDITEIKQAEHAVRASEQRLRTMMDLNPDCVKVISPQGDMSEMNRAGLDLLEAPSLEAAHVQRLIDYVEPEDRSAFDELHRKVMAGGAGELEFDIRGLRGGLKRLKTHAVPLRDGNGNVEALLGITRDITEQKKRAALGEGQKAVLEMIAQGKPIPQTMDELLHVIESYAPDILCSVLMVDEEGFLRPCSAPSLHPDFIKATDGIKIGEAACSCGTAAYRREPVYVEDIENDPLWAGFSEFTVGFGLRACWSTPILDGQDKVLATFAIYSHQPGMPSREHLYLIDLATHLAAICLIRNNAEKELKASEWRFRRLIESIDEIFWMSDAESGKILYTSPQYDEVFGQSREAIYENAGAWLELVHPEDRQRIESRIKNSALREGYDETFRIIHPKKGVRWLQSKAYSYRDNHQNIGGRVGVVTDLTDKKFMEEQLFRAQRLEAVGTLAGGIAHDLNNILAPILVACGMLKTGLENDVDRKMVETLEKSAQRGAAIIRKLLDFSRGSAGTVSDVDPQELVAEVSDLIRETSSRSIKVSEQVQPDLWKLRVDPSHLHQILMNLCVNARDAMPNGGCLEIRVSNCDLSKDALKRHPDARIGRYILFAVEDNGEGMTPELQKRVFDPFFTTKEVGKGSGLGLASVLGIVKNYHGFVTIYSKPGEGSCVRIYLPVSAEKEEQSPSVIPEESPRVAEQPGELIMIVDDEPSICATIGTFLQNHHYRVLTAENGKNALAILRERQGEVRLVVTDMVMPEMNGIEFLRELQREFPKVRTIATSGLVGRGEIIQEGLKDVDVFMEKPYLSAELLTEIRRLLASD